VTLSSHFPFLLQQQLGSVVVDTAENGFFLSFLFSPSFSDWGEVQKES
jgi:hypothetical protein